MSEERPCRAWQLLWMLCIVGWTVAGCGMPRPEDSGPGAEAAATIFAGGPILGLNDEGAAAEALAVANGRIVAIGSRDEVQALRGPDTRQVDLAGRTLVPAFVDHHVHLLNMGMSLRWEEASPPHVVDLAGVSSQEEIGQRLAARAHELPAGTWIVGKGWSQGAWGSGVLPDHHVLSTAVPDHPVYLTRVDGHAGWLNRAALARAGIGAATADPPGGSIGRSADGQPSGVLLERANERVTTLLPAPSDAEVIAAFRLATTALARQGVTEVFDAGFLAVPGVVDLGLDLERYLDLLVRADVEAPLPVRVNLMVPAPSSLARSFVENPSRPRTLSPRLQVTHVKLFMDGAMGSRGALLSHPFADDPTTHGVRRMSREELQVEATAALEAGLDVATHAIGDQAVSDALDVYEQILGERPAVAPGRLRIEHFSYARADDFDRAARLGVVLSIQPNFVFPADDGLGMEDARVGMDNSERVYAWGRLRDLGARLAFGSDYFTHPFAPLYTFYAAVTRRNPAGLPVDGWHPDQRLDRFEALRWATTVQPVGGEEGRSGLGVGQSADLVILSQNPLSVPSDAILDIAVEATYRAGTTTFTSTHEP